jgi:hypothetical protein
LPFVALASRVVGLPAGSRAPRSATGAPQHDPVAHEDNVDLDAANPSRSRFSPASGDYRARTDFSASKATFSSSPQRGLAMTDR